MKKYQVTVGSLNIRGGPGTGYDVIGTVEGDDLLISPDLSNWVPILLEDDSLGWVSGKFLSDLGEYVPPSITPPITPPITPVEGVPVWITWAESMLGTKEVPGAGDNPKIVEWDKMMTTLPPSMRHDSTAWCAIFVHAAFLLSGSGIKPIESAAAVDWLGFGKATDDPQKGDVVVFQWDSGSHHVAFVLSVSGNEVHVIGGNQSDAVTKATYILDNVMENGFRRPV